MGGKSKSVTVGYKYFLGMHHAVCHGPIDNISRITVDDRIVWSGEATGGSININAPTIFGGDSREGGVSGTVDVEMGGPAQGQNSYLVSKLGAMIPSYRGVVAMVLRQCYLGNNPYLKPWRYRGQRIHTRQDGLAQWYDEKAEIVGIVSTEKLAEYNVNIDAVANGASTPAGGLGVGIEINGQAAEYALVVKPNYAGPYVAASVWGIPNYTGSSNSGSTFRFAVIKNGDTAGRKKYASPGANYDGYAAARAAFASKYPNGVILRGASNYEFYFEDTPTSDNSGGVSLTVEVYPGATIDMNPAHIIRECLTDPDWGMGYIEDDIDDAAFTAAADTLFDEGLGLSLLWDRQITLQAFVGEILKHIDGALYVSRTTGKFVLKLIRDDYDPGTLLELNESNIVRVSDPSRTTFGELVNSVTVNYWDALTGKDASLTITDTAMVQVQGAVINTTLQYPGFTNARNATIAGQRDLRSLSSPILSCTILANGDAADLSIGDVFSFSWAKWELADVPMRVTGISYGTGRNKQVRIECTQDVFGTPGEIVVSTASPSWSDPSQPPTPIPAGLQIAFEAPYYELVQAQGQATTDSNLTAQPEVGYVMAAAGRPDNAISARMWLDDGDGYVDNGGLDFCPSALLDADIGKTTTVLAYTDGDSLEEVEVGSHCQVGSELMRVDAIDTGAGTITVGRGVLDTVPEIHLSGTPILFWDLFNGVAPTEYVLGEVVDVKVTPVTGTGELDLAAATISEATMAQRAWSPYPPGNLLINGLSYPDVESLAGEITVSWSHRDRLQQTSGILADHFDGDIGPEAGTVYRVRGYINDVLSYTEDDIASTSTTWAPATDGLPVRIEVHSKRDGVYSLQAPWHEFLYGDSLAADEFWDAVVFLTYGEGTDGATAFTDYSKFARVITTFGAAQADTDVVVVSSPSILFTSASDYLAGAVGSGELDIGVDGPDFCFEAYGYCTDFGSNINDIMGRRRDSGQFKWYLSGSDMVFATFSGTGQTTRVSAAHGMSLNTVHHMCAMRVGTTYYLFVDGVLIGSAVSAGGSVSGNNNPLYVGHIDAVGGGRYWRGNLNWVRATMAARYDVAGFTPPSVPFITGPATYPPAPNPTFANVAVLVSFDGVDEATAAVDDSVNAFPLTFNGNAKLDDAAAPLSYTTSLLLDGTGDYVTIPHNALLSVAGTGNFCIEAWIYPTASKGTAMISNKRSGSTANEHSFSLNSLVPVFTLFGSGNARIRLSAPDPVALNEWSHVAVSRQGSFVRLFVNGELVAFGYCFTAPGATTVDLKIGRDGFDSSRDFIGRIGEYRFTQGETVYTESFAVPTDPFPRS